MVSGVAAAASRPSQEGEILGRKPRYKPTGILVKLPVCLDFASRVASSEYFFKRNVERDAPSRAHRHDSLPRLEAGLFYGDGVVAGRQANRRRSRAQKFTVHRDVGAVRCGGHDDA